MHGSKSEPTNTRQLKCRMNACKLWLSIFSVELARTLLAVDVLVLWLMSVRTVLTKEQFTVNIRWIDQHLKEHEDFIGLYQVNSITADCLLSSIKDALVRMNLKLSTCRGQCYDGASNMSGSRNGVAKKILEEENPALNCTLLKISGWKLHCWNEIGYSDLLTRSLEIETPQVVNGSSLCRYE